MLVLSRRWCRHRDLTRLLPYPANSASCEPSPLFILGLPLASANKPALLEIHSKDVNLEVWQSKIITAYRFAQCKPIAGALALCQWLQLRALGNALPWHGRYTRQNNAVAAFYQLAEDQSSSGSEADADGLFQRQFSSMGTQTAMRDGSSQTCGQDLELEPHVPEGSREVRMLVQLLTCQHCMYTPQSHWLYSSPSLHRCI